MFSSSNKTTKNTTVSFLSLLLILFFIFLIPISSYSQKEEKIGYLRIYGKIRENEKPVNNSIVKVYKDGSLIDETRTQQSGRFDVDFVFGSKYKIEITKEGMVTKIFLFSSIMPKNSDISKIYTFEFIVGLFPEFEDPNMKIFERPLGLIYYNKKEKEFTHDRDYTEEIIEIVMALEAKAQKMMMQFDIHISEGDRNLSEENYDQAVLFYEKALKIFPQKKYPKEKIREAKRKKEISENELKAYNTTIAKADKEFALTDYKNALLSYKNANLLMPSKTYPKNKIKEINKLVSGKQDLNEQYSKSILNADKLFSEKKYSDARNSYQGASTIKPSEEYPKSQISKIDILLAKELKQMKIFNQIIAIADKQFESNEFEKAKTAYSKALTILPDESYPKNQIEEIIKILSKQNNTESEYKNLISIADNQLNSKKYSPAKKSYEKARALKPSENYPIVQITKIDKILSQMTEYQETQAKYDNAIKQADKYFSDKELKEARTFYKKAAQIITTEQYPKTKIIEINKLLENEEKNRESYTRLITLSDQQFKIKEYEKAKTAYYKASLLMPSESYPKEKIREIDKILLQTKDTEDSYNKEIASADKLFNSKEYKKAKLYYNNALEVKTTAQYPKSQIIKIDKIIEMLAAKNNQDKQYSILITEADKLLSNKDYSPALKSYKQASLLKPSETYPKTKITEITSLLNKNKEEDESYKKMINLADRLFTGKKYNKAIIVYNKAIEIKPNDDYPKGRIKEINEILETMNLDSYNRQIAIADNSFNSKSYETAIIEYKKASKLLPSEKYPISKISEIKKILTANNQTDSEYNELILTADNLLKSKEYYKSKKTYEKALVIKANEKYPNSQIIKIDKLLSMLSDREKKEKEYQSLIFIADKDFSNKEYENAKKSYKTALNIKPNSQHPTSRILEIDKYLSDVQSKKSTYDKYVGLADKLFNSKDYSKAKVAYQKALEIISEENYPKEKIKEIDELVNSLKDQAYTKMIANADSYFNKKSYKEAVVSYQKANKMRPNDSYPTNQINKIKKLLSDKSNSESEYKQLILNANATLKNKEFVNAKKLYEDALKIKPGQSFPKEQIKKIDQWLAKQSDNEATQKEYLKAITIADKLIKNKEYEEAKTAYTNASSIKPKETYPKTQITKIDNLLKSMQKEEYKKSMYDKYIASADKAFDIKNYSLALEKYKKASALFTNEEYPKTRIAEIKTISQNKKNELYASEIKNADKYFTSKKYREAVSSYMKAEKYKPSETYPKAQINKIKVLLANNKEAEEKYKSIISNGNKALVDNDYNKAKDLFTQASSLKPNEVFPKKKLIEINAFLDNQKQKRVSYESIIKNADALLSSKDYKQALAEYMKAATIIPSEKYPKTKIKEVQSIITGIQSKAYVKILANADVLFEEKKYSDAKKQYIRAKNLKPSEVYPREQISKLNKLMGGSDYKQIVKNADNYFNSKEYAKAKELYIEARRINSVDTHPKNRLIEIGKILDTKSFASAIGDVRNEIIEKGSKRTFTFDPIENKTQNNFILIKARNLSAKQFKIILNFGKDDINNGGLVLGIDNKKEAFEFKAVVGAQQNWRDKNNNWISITPLGGDIEIIQIGIKQGQ